MQTYIPCGDQDALDEREPCECNGTGVLGWTGSGREFGDVDYCPGCDEGERLRDNEVRAQEARDEWDRL